MRKDIDNLEIRQALIMLRWCIRKYGPQEITEDLPMDIREELLRHGSSINDYVFHVRRVVEDDDPDPEHSPHFYKATEVESGMSSYGLTPKEAVDHYFSDDPHTHVYRHEFFEGVSDDD